MAALYLANHPRQRMPERSIGSLRPDDRQRLYLGTDLGVMVSIDGGNTWMREATGFGPAVTMCRSKDDTGGTSVA